MIDSGSPLLRLPAKPAATILTEFAALQQRRRGGEPLILPALTVHLDNGQTITGDFIDYASAEGGTLLIKESNARYAVTYVAVAAIRALTVHLTEESLYPSLSAK